jgi:hypothetical protein
MKTQKTNDPVKEIARLQKESRAAAEGLRGTLAQAKAEGVRLDPYLVRIANALIDGELAAKGLLCEQRDPETGKMRRWERKSPPNRKGKLGTARLCAGTTKRGTPCQALPVPGRHWCRFHGGAATGPKTEAGKAAIAESNRRRARIEGF